MPLTGLSVSRLFKGSEPGAPRSEGGGPGSPAAGSERESSLGFLTPSGHRGLAQRCTSSAGPTCLLGRKSNEERHFCSCRGPRWAHGDVIFVIY